MWLKFSASGAYFFGRMQIPLLLSCSEKVYRLRTGLGVSGFLFLDSAMAQALKRPVLGALRTLMQLPRISEEVGLGFKRKRD